MPLDPLDRPLDRRQRKSRAALQQSLLTLIAFKPYDRITIDDVTSGADVARGTFYAHYDDKAALLREATGLLIGEITATVRGLPADDPSALAASVLAVLDHADTHEHLYRLVLTGGGGAEPRRELVRAFEESLGAVFARMTRRHRVRPSVPIRLATTAYVGALLGTVEGCLDGAVKGRPAEIAAAFVRGQVGGLERALGFDTVGTVGT